MRLRNKTYKAGNDADINKNNVLVDLIRNLNRDQVHYIELNSAEGIYENGHEGSCMVAMNALKEKSVKYRATLHEIRPDARNKLAKNTEGFNRIIRDDWTEFVDEYKRMCDSNTIMFADPNDCEDYSYNNYELITLLRQVEKNGGIAIAYVPQQTEMNRGAFEHQQIVELLKMCSNCIDVCWKHKNKSPNGRIDHMIMLGR